MGKKTKHKQREEKKKSLWLIVGGAVIMISIVWITMKYTKTDNVDTVQSTQPAADSDLANGGPVTLIATLAPELFSGKARAAYQAAKDIPAILAQLPCYCGCKDGLGHKNNLYCFADSHGNICDLCQTIALEAQEMNRKGMPVSQIRDNIRKAYSGAH